jgi:hypothetical protein
MKAKRIVSNRTAEAKHETILNRLLVTAKPLWLIKQNINITPAYYNALFTESQKAIHRDVEYCMRSKRAEMLNHGQSFKLMFGENPMTIRHQQYADFFETKNIKNH